MAEHDITLTVNGTEHELEVESRTLLVHALRDELGYTGANVGCETSTCGACTVHLDGDAVKSCTLLAVQADGASVDTVEGLAEGGDFHPIQTGFQQEHGLQCGYCTPGMMMTATDLLEENPDPSREEIREGLEGNLCRCTGYQNIVNAVENAAETMGSGAVADGGSVEEHADGDAGCASGSSPGAETADSCDVRWPDEGERR
ncbi:(2Fe-2S)-binding protein [Halogeometricum salsisoli]|uniref:(2Fe-2S)-binding protein n=1 Tax=Halogeometricum salsisoli TaxID=2950536 RepID=UPI00287B9D97|nr:2Fe-2S iron-sulfur cluster-binding protein [Halogeometricum sp. S1BR25-6]